MSTRTILAVVLPVLVIGAAVGGAFSWRASEEEEARAGAEAFLGSLGPGKDRKKAFELTFGHGDDASRRETLEREFEEKLAKLGLFEVTSPSCTNVHRESNFLNTFTMGVRGVQCTWNGGTAVVTMYKGRGVASVDKPGAGFVNF